MTQQFFGGDLVRVAKELDPCKVGFDCDCDAVVISSYAEQYGTTSKGDDKQYTLFILPNGGQVSWYHESDLTFLAEDGWKLLPEKHIMRRNEEAKIARRNSMKMVDA